MKMTSLYEYTGTVHVRVIFKKMNYCMYTAKELTQLLSGVQIIPEEGSEPLIWTPFIIG